MILQQLAADAERIVGDMPPPMYDRRPVKWVIELDGDGRYLGCVPTSGGGRGRDRGAAHLVPAVVRTSGVSPLLLADTPAYTLGRAADDSRAAEKHEAYRALIEACAATTGSAAVQAVSRFLASHGEGAVGDLPEVDPNDLMTFRVAGTMPVDEPAVQAFWAAHCAGGETAPRQCVVCGQPKSIPGSLPVMVKRVPNGQTSGVAPTGLNAEAFESYGLTRGQTAGVCGDCGERFCKALNQLLAAEDSHLVTGPLVYVFWTREGPERSLLQLLSNPDPEAVRNLLASYRTGRLPSVEESAFYATALSASGGRAVIRDWLHTTVGAARSQLARWFGLLAQVDSQGQPGRPLGVYPLAAGLYHNPRKDMPPGVPATLVGAALHGRPLPAWLLSVAVNRCRAEQGVTYPRAALMKAVLVSTMSRKEDYMSALEPQETAPAYLCGRLLAVLEDVQRQAVPGINATLVDRFFGAASTAPASVFGNLLSAAQPHLAKLRKNKKGAYYGLQERMEQVLAGLGGFPRTLTLQEQALFSLGYYHERAAGRAAAQERRAQRETGNEEEG